MIQNALTGEPKAKPKALAQQQNDFTAEGAPAPGHAWPSKSIGAEASISPASATDDTVQAAALSAQAAQRRAGSIALDDWDTLLRAVTSRLRQAVTLSRPHELNGATVPFQASVLDCVDALEILHAAVRDAMSRPDPLLWCVGCANAAADAAAAASAVGPAAAGRP